MKGIKKGRSVLNTQNDSILGEKFYFKTSWKPSSNQNGLLTQQGYWFPGVYLGPTWVILCHGYAKCSALACGNAWLTCLLYLVFPSYSYYILENRPRNIYGMVCYSCLLAPPNTKECECTLSFYHDSICSMLMSWIIPCGRQKPILANRQVKYSKGVKQSDVKSVKEACCIWTMSQRLWSLTLDRWPWTSFINSMSLNFLICKLGVLKSELTIACNSWIRQWDHRHQGIFAKHYKALDNC